MKPAICVICGKKSPSVDGDWVEFSDFSQESISGITHPQGLEWFCVEHLEAAKSIANLSANEGINLLKTKFSIRAQSDRLDSSEKATAKKASFFKRFTKVFINR
jgi:hypothetical protein